MLAANEAQTPLRRNVTIDEVGNAGASNVLGRSVAINGQTLQVRAARLLTSSATTAKPRPCSPALAASMAALSASRLV